MLAIKISSIPRARKSFKTPSQTIPLSFKLTCTAATNTNLIQLFESYRIPDTNKMRTFSKANKNENCEIFYELGLSDNGSYIRGINIVKFQDDKEKLLKELLGFSPDKIKDQISKLFKSF